MPTNLIGPGGFRVGPGGDRVGPGYAPPTPLLETLVDAFDDGTIDTATWVTGAVGAASVAETGGRLRFAVPTSAAVGDFAQLQAVVAYDAVGSSLLVKYVTPATDGDLAVTVALLDAATSASAAIAHAGGNLRLSDFFGATVAASVAFSATAHAWWRLRCTGSVAYADVSADGATWAHPDALSDGATAWQVAYGGASSAVYLFTETTGAIGSAQAVEFDDLNLAPVVLAAVAPPVGAAVW